MITIKSDVTVVGGGIAGLCAAIAAARHGCRVALVQERSVLGGNASSEVGVQICGACSNGQSPSVYAKEGGIIEEIRMRLLQYNLGLPYQSQAMMDAAFFDIIAQEENIRLFLNTVIDRTEVDSGRIRSVQGVQLGSEKRFCFESPLFVDATGDGTVGFQAGAGFMVGREAAGRFGETLAPPEPDRTVLGDTLLFRAHEAREPVVYRRPAFAHDVTKLPFFQNLGKKGFHRDIPPDGKAFGGLWWVEYGGHLDTISDNEDIFWELRKLVYGIWDYIKNSGAFEGVENLVLDHVSVCGSKRESRRLVGDYILKEQDILQAAVFPDAVATGGWPIDLHAPMGIYDEAPATVWNAVPGMYQIPYRCLYAKDVENLFMAGRNISVSHVALGSTRVMATCGCVGQAVGTAAALCTARGCLPREIGARYMEDLQRQLLRDDQTILGMPEKCDGVSSGAVQVRASSERVFENRQIDFFQPLEQSVCLALCVETQRLDCVSIFVNNKEGSPRTLRYSTYHSDKQANYNLGKQVAGGTVRVAPGGAWTTVPVSFEAAEDQKCMIVLHENSSLEVACSNKQPVGAVSFFHHAQGAAVAEIGERVLERLDACISFCGVQPAQRLYQAENVVNGWDRPYGLPNLWCPAAEDGAPELTLAFREPVALEEVHLVFDTDLKQDRLARDIPELARAYQVEAETEGGAVEQFVCEGNFARVCRHAMPAERVRRVTVKIKASGQCTPLYAVKWYRRAGM